MKKSLLILSLLAVALAACSSKEPNTAKKGDHPVTAAGKQKINVTARMFSGDNDFLNVSVRILCVDGAQFVTFGENITQHLNPTTGLPTACTNTEVK
jgi:hypothetical protein